MLSNKKVTVMLNNGNSIYSYVHLSNTYDYTQATNNYIGVILNPTDILLYPDSEIVFESVESQSRYLNSVLIHNIRDYHVYSVSYSEPSSYDYCKLQGTNIYLRKELYSGMMMDMPLIRTHNSFNNIIMFLSHTPYNRDTVVSFRHSERNFIPTWAIKNMRGLLDNDIENPLYIYTRDCAPTLVNIHFQSNDNEAINSLKEIISNFKSAEVPFFESINTTSSSEFGFSFFVPYSTNTSENNITNFILMCKLLNVKPIYVAVQLNINEDDLTQFMKIDQMFEITDMVS